MYEKMPQHSQADMQSAVQAKIMQTRAYGQERDSHLGSVGAAMLGSIPRDKPMLEVEYDQLEQAALELDQSVQWLIQRIQPICQPSTAGKAIEGNSCGEPASPSSEMRTKLKNLRGLIETISSRIADVRYTIEV